jgi:CDP-diacylglycerol--serine O-phosphatidyltransferase
MSWLMVSRVPTLSLKTIHVPPPFKKAVLGVGGLVVASAVLWPWATLTVGLLAYLVTIPFVASQHDSGDPDLEM